VEIVGSNPIGVASVMSQVIVATYLRSWWPSGGRSQGPPDESWVGHGVRTMVMAAVLAVVALLNHPDLDVD
jgi:hypothetical protein